MPRRFLFRLFAAILGGDHVSDGELLRRFVSTRDSAAFELLVRRHADAVWAAAVRILAHDADAVRLQLRLPPDLPGVVAARPELVRALRAALFRHRVRTAPGLDGVVNVFGRDWLAQAFLCAAAGCATAGGDIATEPPDRLLAALTGALDALFQAMPAERPENDTDADPADAAAPAERKKAHQKLLDALADEEEPELLVDFATLTGAARVALGPDLPPFYTEDDGLAADLARIGEAVNDPVWRLPLWPPYAPLLDSKVADMKNTGGKWGGSISAAQFLQRFIKEGTPWAHLDIAGTAMSSVDSEINRSWGSGFGVRLLDRLIADQYERR